MDALQKQLGELVDQNSSLQAQLDELAGEKEVLEKRLQVSEHQKRILQEKNAHLLRSSALATVERATLEEKVAKLEQSALPSILSGISEAVRAIGSVKWLLENILQESGYEAPETEQQPQASQQAPEVAPVRQEHIVTDPTPENEAEPEKDEQQEEKTEVAEKQTLEQAIVTGPQKRDALMAEASPDRTILDQNDSPTKKRKKMKENEGTVTIRLIRAHNPKSKTYYRLKTTVPVYRLMKAIAKKDTVPLEMVRFYRKNGEIVVPTLTPEVLGWQQDEEVTVKFVESEMDELEGKYMGD